MMIFGMLSMIGANILLQVQPLAKPLMFIYKKFGQEIKSLVLGPPNLVGINQVALPRVMSKKKANVMIAPIVDHLMEMVNDHLDDMLKYGSKVHYFLYKKEAKKWAAEKRDGFVDDGAVFGDMPVKFSHRRLRLFPARSSHLPPLSPLPVHVTVYIFRSRNGSRRAPSASGKRWSLVTVAAPYQLTRPG